MSEWFNAHAHSQYSKLDGLPKVQGMVEKVAKMGQPAFALCDHGDMGGTTQGYIHSMKNGLAFFPGFEGYLLDPKATLTDANAARFHFGMLALNYDGYQAVVKLNDLSHTRPRFNKFPRLTLDDLIAFGRDNGKNVALLTGCFFGLVQQTLFNLGVKEAMGAAQILAANFPNTFLEVQHHNIQHSDNVGDDEMVSDLVVIANKLSLPMVASQDSHYLDQADKSAHSLMKRMVYGGEDDAFPGDYFHVASEEWVEEHYDKKVWQQALQGATHLLDLNSLRIPALDKFEARIPEMYPNADTKLALICAKRSRELGLDNHEPSKKRLAYELGVIRRMGRANYFLFVAELARRCRVKKVCIEIRGSANGSHVLRVIGVHQVDVLKLKLSFDRFLSEDRVKPPDVDIDIEDAYRDWAVAEVQSMCEEYGFPGAIRIGSWSQLGIRETDGQGSVVVTYRAYLAKQAEKKGEKFKYGWLQNIDQVADINKRDYRHLKRLDDLGSAYRSYGVHAAGVLLPGTDLPIDGNIPLHLIASSDTLVTALDQDDVEEWGLTKLDLLGQVSLTVMRRTQELIGRKDPTDFSWIPDDDLEACKLLREGRENTGIFHFEGYALADTEPVLTKDGWKTIGSLIEGDMAVDPDGGVCEVQGVYPQGIQQLYRVTLSDGSSVEATADHLWNFTVNGDKRTGTTEELIRVLGTTQVAKLPQIVPTDLGTKQKLPIDPYTLGLLLGDGSFRNKSLIRFSTKDTELLEAIEQAHTDVVTVKDNGYGYYWKSKLGSNMNSLRAGIAALGLSGLYSHEKFIPDQYKWAPVYIRLAVLQGLLDTDGSLAGTGGRFTNTSKRLVEDVRWLVQSLGGRPAQVTTTEREPAFVCGNKKLSEHRTMYGVEGIRLAGDLVPFRLQRKASGYRSTLRRYGHSVVSVVKTRRARATCISVDSKSACFVTRDFIVTHNTKAKGSKEMGIKSTMDAILAIALYMPATMDPAPGHTVGQTELYIQRRRNPELRKQVTYLHPIFEQILKPTFGAVVFQDQVLEIMRGLGMSQPAVNKFIKVVKDSGKGATERNRVRLAEVREEFDEVCRGHQLDPDEVWAQTAAFAAYGFGKAHSAGYGIRAYRSAYLKAHYAAEFMAALLQSWSGRQAAKGQDPKEVIYAREARRIKLRLMPADVNVSGATWTLDRRGRTPVIRRGLVSIKGVGFGAANELEAGAPYSSIQDIIDRTPSQPVTGGKEFIKTGNRDDLNGVLGALDKAGALDDLE